MVGDVGSSLVSDSNNLADRTQSQAASLEETTASVRLVGDMVKQNSDDSQSVSGLTRNLQRDTEQAELRRAVHEGEQRAHAGIGAHVLQVFVGELHRPRAAGDLPAGAARCGLFGRDAAEGWHAACHADRGEYPFR